MYLWSDLMCLSTDLVKGPREQPYTHLIVLIVLIASATFPTLSVRGAWLFLPSIARVMDMGSLEGRLPPNEQWIKYVVLPALVWAFLMPVALAPEVRVEGISATFVYALTVTFVAKLLGYYLASRSLKGNHKECLRENLWLWNSRCSATSSLALALGVLLVQWVSGAWVLPEERAAREASQFWRSWVHW